MQCMHYILRPAVLDLTRLQPFVVPEILENFVKVAFVEDSQPMDGPIPVYIVSTGSHFPRKSHSNARFY